MLCMATTPEAKRVALDILRREIGVQACADFEALFWLDENKDIEWVVGYTSFLGKTCQGHMVNLKGGYTPKKLLFAVFDYPFNYRGIEKVLGIVNSLNTKALAFDLKVGFKEILRLPGMHDDGGDLVVVEMNKSECRWIKGHKK